MHWIPSPTAKLDIPYMAFRDRLRAFLFARVLRRLSTHDSTRNSFETRQATRFAWLPVLTEGQTTENTVRLRVWLETYTVRQRWLNVHTAARLGTRCGWHTVMARPHWASFAAVIRDMAARGEADPKWRHFGEEPAPVAGRLRHVTRFAWLPRRTVLGALGDVRGQRPGPLVWLKRYRLTQVWVPSDAHPNCKPGRGRWRDDVAEPMLADELRHTGAPLTVPHGTGDEADIAQVVRRATTIQRQK